MGVVVVVRMSEFFLDPPLVKQVCFHMMNVFLIWQRLWIVPGKRGGHSSHIGTGSIIDLLTGLPIDYVVISNCCFKCQAN